MTKTLRALQLTAALTLTACAGQTPTPASVLGEVNRAVDALMAAYQAFCPQEKALQPECTWLSERLGLAMQQRGQLAVSVAEAKP